MPAKNRPFPIQMEVEFLDRLSEPVREGKAKSVSEIIRTALERYDFSNVVVMHPSQLTISVRLESEIRRNLKQISRAKHTSVGQLVRAAVGYDQSRNDQVTVISSKFAGADATVDSTPWYQASWIPMVLRNVTAIVVALLVLLFGVRPLAKTLLKSAIT